MGREGDSYISPSVQRDAIQRWADYKGILIAEWHVDEDWSGGTHERPGLERAIDRALNGETGGIVSANIDRFSRTTELGLRELRRLEAADARLAFVLEDIDTATVYGKMIYTILLAVAEAFLANIKANWVIAKSRAVARGAYISRTPWGYARNDDGTLRPHPERAEIVIEAFRRAASDSLHAAMTYLKQVAPERQWTTTKVRRLLGQRSYLGETRNGDVVAAGTHEPLVSRAIWEAAQTAPVGRRSRGAFPLSGLARCGSCNSPMVGSRGGKGQRTYRCSASLSLHRGESCPRGTVITASRIEDYVTGQARQLLAGLRLTVSEPETDRLTLLERTVNDAEAELDAFAGDMTMRRALGDRYHQHLTARTEAVEKARAAYREQARNAQTEKVWRTADLLDDDPEVLSVLLRSILAAIVVVPGRGLNVADRVRLIPLDADAVPGVATPE
jgi:DNA invertase Pin-like site-specific DNA recombinase